MDGVGINLALGALKAIAFVCDILTFPVYAVLQKPWKRREQSRRIKGEPMNKITPGGNSLTFRTLDKPGKVHVDMVRNKVDTIDKMMLYVSKVHCTKRCLGTRDIIKEEDEVQPNGRVFKKFVMGEYKWKTFSEVEEAASRFGRGLRELGNMPKENMVIFAETRAEWMIAAHGLFKQNIPVVTIYATLGDDAIAHGINETEVTTVITSHELLHKFKHILQMTPRVKTIIYMEDQIKKTDVDGFKEGVQIIPFQRVIQMGATSKMEPVPPTAQDTAIIMYTSGSTGVPKGVILSHHNVIASMKAFSDAVIINEDDILIGFLPLAHVFELLAESVCLLMGVPIGYSNPLTLIDSSSKIKRGTKGDATVLHPTCMTSVPLILDRISKGIQEKVSSGSAITRVLFKFAYDYKRQWVSRGYQTPLLNKIIFSKVTQMLGGRMRLVLSGGAPLSPDTHEQIQTCLCVGVIQGYGLTETTSCATVMDENDMELGRVGHPTTSCDIRLINWEEGSYRITDKPWPRGEVIIGGDNISSGYYKLPEKSKEEFFEEDGKRWFRTGDIGEVHEDGVLKIIDRKKDLVKLQAGEYVSLGKVEAELKTCPVVENICVYGDSSKHYTVALVVPNQKQLEELALKQGVDTNIPFEQLCTSPEVEKAVVKELAEHAKKCRLEKFEVPAAVTLCSDVWTPDMGLVTAAFKLKRKDIQERYQHEINRMYAS